MFYIIVEHRGGTQFECTLFVPPGWQVFWSEWLSHLRV